MKRIILTIICECNGKELTGDIREAILKSREEMCDILNGEGGFIEKYNEAIELLGIAVDKSNGAYLDSYIALTNECWTKLLNDKGYPHYKIISEEFIPNKNILEKFRGIDYVALIKLEKI